MRWVATECTLVCRHTTNTTESVGASGSHIIATRSADRQYVDQQQQQLLIQSRFIEDRATLRLLTEEMFFIGFFIL